MCGRFTLTLDQEALQVALGVEGLLHPSPRYNVAPTQEVPAVASGEEGVRGRVMRWGLVPSWADDPSIGNRMINARSETVDTRPSFRAPFRRSRCLVPADGFYEWQEEGGRKVPYRIRRPDHGLFTFAGLWDRWRDPQGEEVATFTILTADAEGAAARIHHRMPVILPESSRDAWLSMSSSVEELRSLLNSNPVPEMAVDRVSTRVNSPANDDPECVRPLEDPEGGSQLTLLPGEG